MVAILSLCGVPFIRGFYSKDCIVEGGLMCNQSIVFYIILIVGLITTFYYSMRMAYRALCGVNKIAVRAMKAGEQAVVKCSYVRLFIGAVLIGYFLVELIERMSLAREANTYDKIRILGIRAIAYRSYYIIMINEEWGKENFFCFFFRSIGHIKHIRGNVVRILGMLLSDCSIRVIDKGWLEKVGPQGAREVLGHGLSRYNQRVQSGQYFQVLLGGVGIGFRFLFLLVLVG